MKIIKLTQGKEAIVDDEDFEELNKYKWCYNCGYAVRGAGSAKYGNRRLWLMHREVNKTPAGLVTDHKDGNKLNNVRSNLRNATVSQNVSNKINSSRTSSGGYRGVSKIYHLKDGTAMYSAHYRLNGKRTHLGVFNTAIAAAKVYNTHAAVVFGEFAVLNIIVEDPIIQVECI